MMETACREHVANKRPLKFGRRLGLHIAELDQDLELEHGRLA